MGSDKAVKMDEMAWKCLLVLGVLGVLAGFSAGPLGTLTPQKEPATVMLVNNASITETFEVGVVPQGASIQVTRGEDKLGNYTVGEGSSTIKNPDTNQFRKVKFPDSARMHGEYTIEPGERKQLAVKEVYPDEAIVILVYDEPEGSYRAIKTLGCSGAILGYKVETQAEGEDQTLSIHECSNW